MNGHLQGLYPGEINPTLILFSHEARLHLNGHVKSQNKEYWSAENPMVIHTVSLYDVKGHVWCVANATRIIGFTFFKPEIHTNT
jgi:hypothetical protein